MIPYKGGAVATTAKGGSPKRDAVATGDSHNIFKYTESRPDVSPNFFKGWRSLVVKYNGRRKFEDEEKLYRVLILICSILGFETTDAYESERGKQDRLHAHTIVRAKKLYNVEAATEELKAIGSIKYPIFINRPMGPENEGSRLFMEFETIDLSSYTFRIEMFSNNEHLFHYNEVYLFKEKQYRHPHVQYLIDNTNFIDSSPEEPEYDIKNIFISAMSKV